MDLVLVPEWLKIVFIVWGIVSLIAAPIVGRFLAGALHENVGKVQDDAPPMETRTASWRRSPVNPSRLPSRASRP